MKFYKFSASRNRVYRFSKRFGILGSKVVYGKINRNLYYRRKS